MLLLSLYVSPSRNVLSQWNPTAHGLCFRVPFPRLSDVMVHQCHSICEAFFILIAKLVFHCMAMSQSVRLSRGEDTAVVPIFGYSWTMLPRTFVDKYQGQLFFFFKFALEWTDPVGLMEI